VKVHGDDTSPNQSVGVIENLAYSLTLKLIYYIHQNACPHLLQNFPPVAGVPHPTQNFATLAGGLHVLQ
jgi:hypothetical protein